MKKSILIFISFAAVVAYGLAALGSKNVSADPPEKCKVERRTDEVDLDLDGKPEKITFEWGSEMMSPYYKCHGVKIIIDGDSVTKHTEGEVNFHYYDIDPQDRAKEFAIFDTGPSDDPETFFYWWDGKKIRYRGSTMGEDPEMPGNGALYGSSRDHCFPTTEKYTIDPQSGELVKIPQTYYSVGGTWVTKPGETLALYETPELKHQVEVIPPGKKYSIMVCKVGGRPSPSPSSDFLAVGNNGCQACLVETKHHIVGWTDRVEVVNAD